MEDLIYELKGQESEVESFCVCKVNSASDIENIPLAFPSAKKALTEWIKVRSL